MNPESSVEKTFAIGRDPFIDQIDTAEIKIQQMIVYMKLKITQRDWHAVADAAMDIRELEERKRTLTELQQ